MWESILWRYSPRAYSGETSRVLLVSMSVSSTGSRNLGAISCGSRTWKRITSLPRKRSGSTGLTITSGNEENHFVAAKTERLDGLDDHFRQRRESLRCRENGAARRS